MRDRRPQHRQLSLELLEDRVVLSSASGLLPDVTVDEDALDSVIDLDAVFGASDLGLSGPLTYTVTVSTPIENLVRQVSQSNYTALLQDLLYTHIGDNRGLSGPEHGLARDNIADYFTALGLQTSLEPFLYSWSYPPITCHNVVGIHPGTVRPDEVYLVGAHYDSADNPGADDNASGTAAVMEIARVLSQYSFEATLVFVVFDREEQGMLGSYAYVNAHASDNILGMVNLDMIAYNAPDAGRDTVWFYDCVTGGVIKSQLAAAFAAYGDGLAAVDGGYDTASDHFWFEKRGFDAALVIENGWASNPYYHQAGDAVESADYFDYEYATKVTRGTLGYLATAAGLQDTIELLTATVHGAVDGTDLILAYVPDANGTADICVRARDAQDRYVEDTFRVTVNPVNDPPTLNPIDDRTIRNDAQADLIPLRGISSGDGIGQPVRVTAVSSLPGILPNPEVSYVRLTASGTLRLTPVAHATGTVVITVTVEDGGADNLLETPGDNAVTTQKFTVEVLPPQHPPSATADHYSTAERSTLVVSAPGVLANDEDEDGDDLHAVLVRAPAHGVVQLRPDGSFTYTPNSTLNREDTFTYVASDGTDESPPVTVQIVINTAYPWHNGLNLRDVNDDGFITPVDSLQIINAINRGEGTALPLDRPRPLQKPFYDVNRDGFLSPLDALQVINYLNRGDGEGEDEGTVADADLLFARLADTRDDSLYAWSHGEAAVLRNVQKVSSRMIHQTRLPLSTQGYRHMQGITQAVVEMGMCSGVETGIGHLFNIESTAGLGTIEFEPGLQTDFPATLDPLILPSEEYVHEQTWHDGKDGQQQTLWFSLRFSAPACRPSRPVRINES